MNGIQSIKTITRLGEEQNLSFITSTGNHSFDFLGRYGGICCILSAVIDSGL